MPPVSVEQLEKPIIFPTALERHWKFWRLEKTDRPIIGLFLQPYLVPDVYRIAADDDLLEPQQIKAELFFDLHLERHQAIQDLPQDFVRPVEPLNWMPWLEAILGLPLKVKNQSVWAEPVLNIDQPLREFWPGWSEDWMETAFAYVRDLVKEFHPRIPVAGPFLRGPADVVSAMLGTSRFCVELVDHPEEIERLVSICALAWIKVSRAMMGIIPDWQGGYFPGARWIHAPGVCVYTSEDATSLISRKMYEKHFLPANMQMSVQFPYGFVHRHSAAIHNIESLCQLPQKWAVEVTLDPSGPALEKILPVLQKVQQSHHPLIVFGISEPEPLHFLLGTLLPEGLCLILQSDTADQARTLLESFAKKNK
jgi:hypothetical protein